MKIVEIKRKVTGNNYSNLELTAQVDSDQEDIDKCAIELDETIKKLLKEFDKIDEERQETEIKKNKNLKKLEELKKQINKDLIDDLPF